MTVVDTHQHFDFLEGVALRRAFLASLPQDVRVVAQTVTPSGFWRMIEDADALAADGLPLPLWSAGFHPWWISSEEQADEELGLLATALERTRFVGEIGLDFAPRRLETVPEAAQRRVLARVLQLACAAAERWSPEGPVVLSLHAVRAADAVLDLWAEHAVHERGVVAVFHWFSGTGDDLTRLLRMGGYLSVQPRMLDGKRGRASVRQAPADRLLLETDQPADPVRVRAGTTADRVGGDAADAVTRGLSSLISRLVELRGPTVIDEIERTQERLYGVG